MRPLCVLQTPGTLRKNSGRVVGVVDGDAASCYKDAMDNKRQPTMSAVLKAAIERSGLSVYRIGQPVAAGTQWCVAIVRLAEVAV